MTEYNLTLDYELHPGWAMSHVDGLQKGVAVARACKSCGCVSFPPVRVCACGSREGDWRQLAGTARIELRTSGADGEFGLVAFDGADTKTVVRIVGFGVADCFGRLVVSENGMPALCLAPIVQETTQ